MYMLSFKSLVCITIVVQYIGVDFINQLVDFINVKLINNTNDVDVLALGRYSAHGAVSYR